MVEAPEGYVAEDVGPEDDAQKDDAPGKNDGSNGAKAGQAAGAKGTADQPLEGKKRPAPHPHYDSNADTKPMAVPAEGEFSQHESPVLPTSDWSSSEAQKMKRILLLSGLGVGAVVIAVALGGFWLSQSRSVAAADKGTAEADDPNPGSPPPTAIPDDQDQAADTAESDGTDSTGTDATGADATGTDSTGTDATGTDATGTDATGTTDAAPKATGEDSADKPADGAESFDPEPSSQKPVDGDADAADLTKSLRKLESLLALDEEDAEPRTESPLTAIKQPIVLAPKPAARNVDIDVQLRRPVASVEFENVPLVGFIRFISKMSTIPISLDPIALQAKGLTGMTPVAVRQEDTTVGAVLESVLAPQGLVLARGKNHLRVELAKAAPSRLDVSDLLTDSSLKLGQVANWLNPLLESKSSQGDGSEGGLTVEGQIFVIDGHPNLHFETKRFLDRLRFARGLEGRHGIPANLLELELTTQPAKLEQRVSANFRIPAAFTDVLDHLAQAAEVDLLVDWESATAVGWNPDGLARLNVEDVPLSEALTQLLEPMELSYRLVAPDTIQIVSLDRAAATERVFFHPASGALEILDGDEASLVTLLQATLGAARFRPNGSISVFVEPDSKRLITYASPRDHAAILKLLEKTGAGR